MSRRKPILIPVIVFVIVSLLTVGFAISSFEFGFQPDILRALRGALNLPVFWLIAANLADTPKKARYILWAFLLGMMVATIGYFWTVIHLSDSKYFTAQWLRIIAYGGWIVGVGINIGYYIITNTHYRLKLLIAFGIMIWTVNIMLTQARSLWIATTATFLLSLLFLSDVNKRVQILVSLVLFLSVVVLLFANISGNLSLFDVITNRIDSAGLASQSRSLALTYEFQAWENSSLLLGRGLGFELPYEKILFQSTDTQYVAWGHLGHLTTLAQLGIVGYIVYYIAMPFILLRDGTRLRKLPDEDMKFIGSAGIISLIYYWVMTMINSSFLDTWTFSFAVIAGTVWSMNRLRESKAAHAQPTDSVQTSEQSPALKPPHAASPPTF